jgi:hypothetical protein
VEQLEPEQLEQPEPEVPRRSSNPEQAKVDIILLMFLLLQEGQTTSFSS